MSNQNIPSNLLVELSIEEQQLLSGGKRGDGDDGDDEGREGDRYYKPKKSGSWYGR
jgi:hypothetical protein